MNWQQIFYDLIVPTERIVRFRSIAEKRFKCKTWVTQNNSVIPVTLLRDSHLSNIWRFVYLAAIDAYKIDNWKLFDRRYAQATLISAELKRRGEDYHGMQFNELEEIFMDQDYDDYDDGYPLDHYEAMHYWKGDW